MPRATPLPADERRAAIIAATEPLVEAHGRDVSTRQIAEAAGIAEGTIFRVFASKDALIDAVVEDVFDAGVTCAELLDISSDQPLEARLEAAVRVLQRRMRRIFALFHALRLRPPAGDGEEHRRHRERQEQDNQRIRAALETVIMPDHELLRYAPATAAALISSLTFAVTHPMMREDHERLTPREVADLFLYGLARRPDEGPAEPPRDGQTPAERAELLRVVQDLGLSLDHDRLSEASC